MKCPKCGFVNRPGIPQCKKCGRSFVQEARKEAPARISSLFSLSLPRPSAAASPPPQESLSISVESQDFSPLPNSMREEANLAPDEPSDELAEPSAGATAMDLQPAISPPHPATAGDVTCATVPPLPTHAKAANSSPLWREELSGRVEKFRRRRARLRNDFDPSSSLELDFQPDESSGAMPFDASFSEPNVPGQPEVGRSPLDLQIGDAPEIESALDSQNLSPREGGIRILSGAAVEAGEIPVAAGNRSATPMEIYLDSENPALEVESISPGTTIPPQTMLASRFLAGLVDAAILLSSFGLFAAIFWWACVRPGSVYFYSLDLLVLALIAAFFVLLYFASSVALTSSTPGLSWMGLEVRTMEGSLPDLRESLWRAFGYLVSASSLFLGFLWALFDVDGLTWHDLMSGTYIARKESSRPDGRKAPHDG